MFEMPDGIWCHTKFYHPNPPINTQEFVDQSLCQNMHGTSMFYFVSLQSWNILVILLKVELYLSEICFDFSQWSNFEHSAIIEENIS